MTNPPTAPAQFAMDYNRRGWAPLPLRPRTKLPFHRGWPDLRISESKLSQEFHSPQYNIGVVFGQASDGLTDIDLDCPEALKLADEFLPRTNSVFGRAGKRRSHRLYRVIGLAPTRKFFDPLIGKMLVELRGERSQTAMPGSIHESGECIAWAEDGEPALVEYGVLLSAVRKLGAACLVQRYVPQWQAGDDLAGALRAIAPELKKRVRELVTGEGDKPVAARQHHAQRRAATRQDNFFGEILDREVPPETEYEIAKMRALLSFVLPSGRRLFDPDCSEEEWWRILAAISAPGWSVSLQIADEWSAEAKQDGKYPGTAAVVKKAARFLGQRHGITEYSLYRKGYDNGWSFLSMAEWLAGQEPNGDEVQPQDQAAPGPEPNGAAHGAETDVEVLVANCRQIALLSSSAELAARACTPCQQFERSNPSGCAGCRWRYKLFSPLSLLKLAQMTAKRNAAPGTQPEAQPAPASPTVKPQSPTAARAARGIAQTTSLKSLRASAIKPAGIDWLWPGRFAIGKLGLVVGLPGEGKGQLLAYKAACITRARKWPCGEGHAPLGNVVMLSAEDDPSDTIVPRLIAAGADLERIEIVSMVREPNKERMFNLATDLALLRQKIAEVGDVKLVLIDPISAYLGIGKVDSFRTTDVRAVLAPLVDLAAELKIAVTGIMHFNKKVDVTNALLRISDSLAFAATARHVYAVVDDPAGKRKLFVKAKNNLAPDGQALAYNISVGDGGKDYRTGQTIEAPYISWHAYHVDVTATEALQAATENKAPAARDAAKKFLMSLLAAGPVAKKEIEDAADGHGISTRTLERAKRELALLRKKMPPTEDGLGDCQSQPVAISDFFVTKAATPSEGERMAALAVLVSMPKREPITLLGRPPRPPLSLSPGALAALGEKKSSYAHGCRVLRRCDGQKSGMLAKRQRSMV
jgi:hypothetical protein